MAPNPERHRLTEAEHQSIFEQQIVPALFSRAESVDQPVAVIFGGQPGAGKSATVDAAVGELADRGGAARIIGDELRTYHTAYADLMAQDDKTAAFYTDRDSGRWIEKAIQHAKDLKVNLVIEGTMRDGSKVAETMTSLREAGYQIDARALAVNERLSWQGVLQRYEEQRNDRGSGRMTAPHSHRDAYEGIPATLERIERERLADRVSLYRRGGQVIYANELDNGAWRKLPQAREFLDAERGRAPTLAERQAYADGFESLHASLIKPGRNAAPAEVQSVDLLRQQSRRELLAAALTELPRDTALRQFPELSGAYKTLDEVDSIARSQGKTAGEQKSIQEQALSLFARSLEKGQPLAENVIALATRTAITREDRDR